MDPAWWLTGLRRFYRMALKVIGLDIAKHVFQLHGADAKGKAVLKKTVEKRATDGFLR
jgi:hypothetical protein